MKRGRPWKAILAALALTAAVPLSTAQAAEPTFETHDLYMTGTGPETFSPLQTTTRAEAIAILTRMFYGEKAIQVEGKSSYSDVAADAWYYKYVAFAQKQGLLEGLHETGEVFRPEEFITRAEYMEMLCRFFGIYPSESYGVDFSDVSQEHWSVNFVRYAAAAGWTTGYPDGTFGPEKTLSRSEMVTMTNRAFGRIPDTGYIDQNGELLISFTDVPSTYWAYYQIMEASNPHESSFASGTETWKVSP